MTYEDRLRRRRERLEATAARERTKAAARFDASDQAVAGIPFGQRTLVGHHSEPRHRRAIQRAQANVRKAIEHVDRAKEYERRAARVGSGGISSDDEHAVGKLEAKLAALQAQRARLSAANKAIRAGTPDHEVELELTERERALLASSGEYSWERAANGRAIFPPYVLRNLGGRIRQVRSRLEELKAAEAQRENAARVELAAGPGWIAHEDRDDNRLAITFDSKPPAEIRTTLKAAGYRWSPTRGAWVRKLSPAARANLPLVTRSLPHHHEEHGSERERERDHHQENGP